MVGPAWQQVVAAKSWKPTVEAAAGLAQAVKDGGARLAYITAPQEAAAGHDHLKRAFASFGNDFDSLAPVRRPGHGVRRVLGSGPGDQFAVGDLPP